MICSCDDWKVNQPLVDAGNTLQALRGWGTGYTGKIFVYCPWCGEKLTEERLK